MSTLYQDTAFREALWTGLIQLLVLAITAVVGNFIYRRLRDRSQERLDLMRDIHDFTVRLYRPRKLYQLCDAASRAAGPREATLGDPRDRAELRVRALEDLVGVIGQFRSIQGRMVSLFGHDRQLFGYFLAIWDHLKRMRSLMEAGLPLIDEGHPAGGVDPLYRLFDEFRYHVGVREYELERPERVWPSDEQLAAMRDEAGTVYARFFGPRAEDGPRDPSRPASRVDGVAAPSPGPGPEAY